jgi:hypothetical protein
MVLKAGTSHMWLVWLRYCTRRNCGARAKSHSTAPFAIASATIAAMRLFQGINLGTISGPESRSQEPSLLSRTSIIDKPHAAVSSGEGDG